MNFDAFLGNVAIPGVVGLIMLVVGLSLTVADFRRVAQYPVAVLVATIGQLLLLPLIALLLVWTFKPNDYVVAGMILLAASPAGGLSNFYALLGRGNVAFSVTLTAISNLLCFFTLPLIAAPCFAWVLDSSEAVQLPLLTTIRHLFIMLALPLVVGMVVRHRWPEFTQRWRPLLGRTSLIALAVLVITILVAQRNNFQGELVAVIWIAIAFYLLAIAAGWLTGKAVQMDDADRFTVMLEYPARNLGITAVVGVMALGRADFVLFATVLFLIQTPVLLGVVGIRRLQLRKAADGDLN